MNKLKIFSIALLVFGATANAQDLDQAKKAIDAEQYEKAKGMLKSLINTKPDSGKNFFILGNLYLTQKLQDSANMSYQKGILAKNEANFNYIGLGQIDLENNNSAAAKSNFDKALSNVKKKDFEELLYVSRAFMSNSNPDYKTALTYLERAKVIQSQDAQVQLAFGDAYFGMGNVNDAFSAYRNSFDADNTVLRAKLQLGVITKGSKAFPEAKTAFEDILKTNPGYGPAYRELAETYYLWAINEKDKTKYPEYNKTAINYYDKYLSLTDYSLDSRMRHADFLILTKDYKALEAEAEAMQKLDKVNPRILRYLGYSAYENGNNDGAIKAINEFLSNRNAKIIGRDFLYLGFAKTKKALTSTKNADGTLLNKVDKILFESGVADLKKGVELDPVMANELNDFGKIYFDIKLYKEAAAIYDVATLNPNSRNFLFDNYYYGYATYFDLANQDKPDVTQVAKANTAFSNVISIRPTFTDAYIYKARLNSLLPTDEMAKAEMAKFYEEFIQVVTAKGVDEVTKNKTKFVEAYNNIGIYFAKTDKVKAKENFEKALAIDPTNETALSTLKLLK
ncbi:MAG: tetratricopeptide repeat protein [Flavobacterium sp.]|nr:tetratricopeptide repeat protein [Flavobacterium sp.]